VINCFAIALTQYQRSQLITVKEAQDNEN
jgi:hypothetical protein